MFCPKKGNKLPCVVDNLSPDDWTVQFANALRADTNGLLAAAKVISTVAQVSERTGKNWLAGRCAPQHPVYLARLAAVFTKVRDVWEGAMSTAERDAQVRRVAAVRARNAQMRTEYMELMNDGRGIVVVSGEGDDSAADVPNVDRDFGIRERSGGGLACQNPHSGR